MESLAITSSRTALKMDTAGGTMACGSVLNESALQGVACLGIRESDSYRQQAGSHVFRRHAMRANLNFTGTEESAAAMV